MLMLAIYTFVFGLVLEIRWPVQEGGQAQFAAILFSGMIVHSLLSDCLTQSTTLISDNPQYVKKVVFSTGGTPVGYGIVRFVPSGYQPSCFNFVLVRVVPVRRRSCLWLVCNISTTTIYNAIYCVFRNRLVCVCGSSLL